MRKDLDQNRAQNSSLCRLDDTGRAKSEDGGGRVEGAKRLVVLLWQNSALVWRDNR